MVEKWYRSNFEFPTGDSSSPLGSNKDKARKKFYKELTFYVEGEERFGKLYGASFIEYNLREGETLAESKVLVKKNFSWQTGKHNLYWNYNSCKVYIRTHRG